MKYNEEEVQNATIYVLGVLKYLSDQEVITGGEHHLTEEGKEQYAKLIKEGYLPSNDLVEQILRHLFDFKEEPPEAIMRMFHMAEMGEI